MNFKTELKKLFLIIFFLKKTILKAFFLRDIDSRTLLSQIYLKMLNSETKIKSIKLFADQEFSLKLGSFVYNDITGPMDSRLMKLTAKELFSILILLKKQSPKTIFEFGLLYGGSLYHFIENTEPDSQIYSLDIATNNLTKCVQDKLKGNTRVNIIQEDSLKFDPSPFTSKIDFVFIDGGHEYEIVKNDTKKALSMLSQNGIITWDDYNANFTGVYKYLNQLSDSGMELFHIADTSLAFFQKKSSNLLFTK